MKGILRGDGAVQQSLRGGQMFFGRKHKICDVVQKIIGSLPEIGHNMKKSLTGGTKR